MRVLPRDNAGRRTERGPAVLRRLGRIDRKAFDLVASARLPGLEYVLPRLSHSADHGVLWFATAAGLAATRRTRLRRAALRGALGIAVASPAVNVLGKQAFRRKRPVVDLVPPVRIRWKLPTSHAFPSGHSASAAAFATGVALEAPAAVAVPVAATALTVAFSRVYTGAHYPGDVLAGLGVGVAAGLGTRLFMPPRPPAAQVRPTGTESVTVTDDGRGMVAVVNSGSGDNTAENVKLIKSSAEAAVALLRRELPAAEVVEVDPDGDLAAAIDEAAGRAEVLAVIGGDGTINLGAQAAVKHGVPLLPVPGGTFNHFARTLGIDDVQDAIRAYRQGCLGRSDVAYVASPGGPEQPFLNTASFGAYTEMVDRRERLEKRLGKWPALAVAAVRTLRHSEPIDMVVDGRTRKVWLGFVGNGLYGARGPAPTWRDRLDDGRLDVRMVTTGTRRVPRARAVAAVLIGHLHLMPGYRHWAGGRLDLRSLDGALRLARDGEVGTVPATLSFGKHSGALAVFCPPGPPADANEARPKR
ncbi:bifunctional phosphatase PAP2/diacylglycerol kinase family protein [Actinomadura parmotrematis]|uniref:Phosphatase PAP2 family protein n=1 Tax=Actinomadura parmotrematis TaxID=2864039 RepID=A0ABS7FZB2_9ACTN|nr:bifunctional phosphatase PAP2/diacylglycerol kinase family protein [Actinomadura parmotrematis]MBW8485788.1 phosphatase PAP2 family protein [Actinomadura parmotrematis]